MKTWMLLLALYAGQDHSGTPDGLLMVPGTYTKAECAAVKKIFDRDHLAAIGADIDHLAKMFGKTMCLNRPPFAE